MLYLDKYYCHHEPLECYRGHASNTPLCQHIIFTIIPYLLAYHYAFRIIPEYKEKTYIMHTYVYTLIYKGLIAFASNAKMASHLPYFVTLFSFYKSSRQFTRLISTIYLYHIYVRLIWSGRMVNIFNLV